MQTPRSLALLLIGILSQIEFHGLNKSGAPIPKCLYATIADQTIFCPGVLTVAELAEFAVLVARMVNREQRISRKTEKANYFLLLGGFIVRSTYYGHVELVIQPSQTFRGKT